MDGLRSFIEIDNHLAVDVSHLRRGIRPFCGKKPNFSEDHSVLELLGTDAQVFVTSFALPIGVAR